ncbi:hypothetical protein GWN26_01970 [Candidatus Saccharibacteria bacterium]|nr:hypothetical protein [Calditrichia bacterium]NIV71443.1 hypothetical protein [Calditrichia bacterium]NIV97972.1 hypothetical protein [Candidatus Saccharibacteria bacterium]NIW78269.1 hypothetical protein [Calditrichia bacterium]
MDDNKDLICSEHNTCMFRLECLEKWKEGVEKKLDGFGKLLIANLSGIILTLLGIIGGLLIYLAQ